MKWRLVVWVLFLLVFTGCIKSIASEEETDLPEVFNSHKPVGASARELLSDERYTSVKVEIQYMKGFAPGRETLRQLRGFMDKYLHKPGGITIVTKQIDPDAQDVLTLDNIKALEKDYRSAFTTGRQIALYILYTDGMYVDERIFGCAYSNTAAVIFGKAIKDRSGDIGRPHRAKLESTVLLHEMGHLLGLVNTGSDSLEAHHDDAHAKHCTNRKCLMYYHVEFRDPFDYLLRGKIPELDAACAADLRANGGR
jgi:predicted Zn-dependent protease